MPAVASSAGYRSRRCHKISVDDGKLVQSLQARGGRVIADYGSFVLLEANDSAASSLTKKQNAQIVDENNLVLLNAGAIDTTTPAAQSLRTGISAGAANRCA